MFTIIIEIDQFLMTNLDKISVIDIIHNDLNLTANKYDI